MINHPIDNWYNKDQKLKSIINKISLSLKSSKEQAKEAFHQISGLYKLHKFPHKTETEFFDFHNWSVFEEVGIVRFLSPDSDPRAIVLQALHNVKNKTFSSINFCAMKHYGKGNIPSHYTVYFTGEDADSKLCFLEDGENPAKAGLKYAFKVVANK
jgi:hypothetical protein